MLTILNKQKLLISKFKKEKKMMLALSGLIEQLVFLKQIEIKLIKLMNKLIKYQLDQIICNL